MLVRRRVLSTGRNWKPSTLAVHADNDPTSFTHDWDVSPPIGVSTTFERKANSGPDVYSRESCPTRGRCEAVLSALCGGQARLFSSGLSATHAALSALSSDEGKKRRVLISGGYHGTHAVVDNLKSLYEVAPLPEDPSRVAPGDVVWLETPKNPTCELSDVAAYVATGEDVVVDATLAPPPLQNCLDLGARLVVHSSTKSLSGHSDGLSGVVVSSDQRLDQKLKRHRGAVGSVPGSLETWLLLRSLRTLDLRIRRQSTTAVEVARWLGQHPRVSAVHFAAGSDLAKKQMNEAGLVGGTFAIELESENLATSLPTNLALFKDATSLGGCESLAEWRRRYDDEISPRLVRLSVGLEDPKDLIDDLAQALSQ